MQALEYTILLAYGLPGIVLGVSVGYIIGSQQSLRAIDRIGIGLAVGFIGGIIISLIIGMFVSPGDYGIILSILATTMAVGFGETVNWAPLPEKAAKRHVIFDPDEDDREFERQLKRFNEEGS